MQFQFYIKDQEEKIFKLCEIYEYKYRCYRSGVTAKQMMDYGELYPYLVFFTNEKGLGGNTNYNPIYGELILSFKKLKETLKYCNKFGE
jgi:hypothetical protein